MALINISDEDAWMLRAFITEEVKKAKDTVYIERLNKLANTLMKKESVL